MGLFSWLKNKSESEIYKNINPMYGKWLEDYTPIYNNFYEITEKNINQYKNNITEEDRFLIVENQEFSILDNFPIWFEGIKKEIAIIVTDPNPMLGLRYTALENFADVAFFQILEMKKYQNYIHEIIKKDEGLSEFIDSIEYEHYQQTGSKLKIIDLEAEEIIGTLAIRHTQLRLFQEALLVLKDGFNEYPTNNYLYYLHASEQYKAENQIRKLLNLENIISEKDLFLLNQFSIRFINNEYDKNPHYEWLKSMKKAGNDEIVELLEKRKLELYP